jgi:two-component system, OmpR family, sensor histidine kinase KdpD
VNSRGLQESISVQGLRAIASLAVIAALTAFGFKLLTVNATTIGFAYLIAIVIIATAWGLAEAIAASIAAVLTLNYFFLPPIGTFTIEDPENWVALLAFLTTSVIVSQLSVRARREAIAAIRGQAEMQNLYSFSRAILLAGPQDAIAAQAAQQLAQVFECAGAALLDATIGEIYYAGPERLESLAETLRQTAVNGSTSHIPESGVTVFAVSLGGKPIGSAAVKGLDLSQPALESLANLIAIGLEKARSLEAASRAEAAHQSEDLKSTLLDAIAHEFKTPLTSIKAAASGLLVPATEESHRELATIIDEEADRLNALVSEAIQMSRLDAGKVRLERELTAPEVPIRTALRQLGARAEDRAVSIDVAPGLQPISADVQLLAIAMRQVLDNAIKYSPAGKPIAVSLKLAPGGELLIEIRDQGPGIPEKEQTLIFDRFYRGQGIRKRAPGSGMGLAIVREIIELHGGRVWVEAARNPAGTAFFASVPYTPGDEATR